jgi:hypothetical protein
MPKIDKPTQEQIDAVTTSFKKFNNVIPSDTKISTLEWAKSATSEQIDGALKIEYQKKLKSLGGGTKIQQDAMAVYAQKLADLG